LRLAILIDNLAGIAEIELFDDQLILLQLLQGITHGPGRKFALPDNFLMGHRATFIEEMQDSPARLISLPVPTKMFQSGTFPILTDQSED